jgi:hypothetical protein
MHKGYKILEVLEKYNKIPDMGWSIFYDSRGDCDVSQNLLSDNLLNYGESVHIFNNDKNEIKIAISKEQAILHEMIKIDIGEYINYKRTELIDKMLCQI